MGVFTLELPMPRLSVEETETEAAARQGDRSAWSALVEKHSRHVVLALVAKGVKPQRARDLAQEAWMRLISQADARKLEVLLLPGLVIRQALFLAMSEARREHQEPLALAPLAEVPSAEQRYLSAERLARTLTVLKGCHPSAQRVFELVYTQPHLSHAQVAEQVGLSTQRVRQIICEVRKQLRASLEGEGQ